MPHVDGAGTNPPTIGFVSFVWWPKDAQEREFFVANLLVRINFTIVMIRWTGLAPWEFEVPFPGSLTSTFLVKYAQPHQEHAGADPLPVVHDGGYGPCRIHDPRHPDPRR